MRSQGRARALVNSSYARNSLPSLPAAHLEPRRGRRTGGCACRARGPGKQRSCVRPLLGMPLRCVTPRPRCQLTDLIHTVSWDVGTSCNTWYVGSGEEAVPLLRSLCIRGGGVRRVSEVKGSIHGRRASPAPPFSDAGKTNCVALGSGPECPRVLECVPSCGSFRFLVAVCQWLRVHTEATSDRSDGASRQWAWLTPAP